VRIRQRPGFVGKGVGRAGCGPRVRLRSFLHRRRTPSTFDCPPAESVLLAIPLVRLRKGVAWEEESGAAAGLRRVLIVGDSCPLSPLKDSRVRTCTSDALRHGRGQPVRQRLQVAWGQPAPSKWVEVDLDPRPFSCVRWVGASPFLEGTAC